MTTRHDRENLVQLIVDGSWTIPEIAELEGVSVVTVKNWLNDREKGLASKIARRERDRLTDAQMMPVLEWMVENRVHNMTRAALEFGVAPQKFRSWLIAVPERKRTVEAIHEENRPPRVGDQEGAPPPHVPMTREELLRRRAHVRELEARRDELAAEVDGLLDDLMGMLPETEDSRQETTTDGN